jgi:hypothetical protein
MQTAAAVGAVGYANYFVAHSINRAGAGNAAIAFVATAGLGTDMGMDWVEHKLGNPRGVCDEGRQNVGTFPLTHWGPKHLVLPGAVRTQGGGCRIELP